MVRIKLEDLKKITAHLPVPDSPDGQAVFQQRIRQIGLNPDNLYQELEMSSPLPQVHRDISHSNAILHLHSHTFYEILCCRNSCGAEYLVGAERYRLQKGDIVFIPPGVSHRPLLPEQMPEPYIRDVLWISEEFIQYMRRIFPAMDFHRRNHGSLLRTAGTKWEYLCEMLRAAVKEAERRLPGWDMIVTGSSMTFISHLKRAFQDEETVPMTAEEPDLLERAMAYIEKNLSRKI
ncbi:MAG: hypothetical protein IKM31_00005, partial [Oscillospiraceae bacterium]|nr:hypothetical protein [Oscillospiraceae bacterium]